MQIGEWTQRTDGAVRGAGQPLSPKGEGPSLILSERIFSGLSGMGVDSPVIRSPKIVRCAEQFCAR